MDSRMTITKKQKWEEKQLYGHFKTTNKQHLTRQNLDTAKKRKETEPLIITAQNNAIRTNHIKERIDKTQKIANVGYAVTEMKPSIT